MSFLNKRHMTDLNCLIPREVFVANNEIHERVFSAVAKDVVCLDEQQAQRLSDILVALGFDQVSIQLVWGEKIAQAVKQSVFSGATLASICRTINLHPGIVQGKLNFDGSKLKTRKVGRSSTRAPTGPIEAPLLCIQGVKGDGTAFYEVYRMSGVASALPEDILFETAVLDQIGDGRRPVSLRELRTLVAVATELYSDHGKVRRLAGILNMFPEGIKDVADILDHLQEPQEGKTDMSDTQGSVDVSVETTWDTDNNLLIVGNDDVFEITGSDEGVVSKRIYCTLRTLCERLYDKDWVYLYGVIGVNRDSVISLSEGRFEVTEEWFNQLLSKLSEVLKLPLTLEQLLGADIFPEEAFPETVEGSSDDSASSIADGDSDGQTQTPKTPTEETEETLQLAAVDVAVDISAEHEPEESVASIAWYQDLVVINGHHVPIRTPNQKKEIGLRIDCLRKSLTRLTMTDFSIAAGMEKGAFLSSLKAGQTYVDKARAEGVAKVLNTPLWKIFFDELPEAVLDTEEPGVTLTAAAEPAAEPEKFVLVDYVDYRERVRQLRATRGLCPEANQLIVDAAIEGVAPPWQEIYRLSLPSEYAKAAQMLFDIMQTEDGGETEKMTVPEFVDMYRMPE